jgi:hypothetical protein
LDQAKREKAEARRKFGQLVQQKERVDEELNNERQKAMDQKMRADDLEMELRTAQQGNRDKDDKSTSWKERFRGWTWSLNG